MVGLYCFILGVLASPGVYRVLQQALRPLRCRMRSCPGRMVDTDYGIAWHCNTCGKISGFVSNAKLKEMSRHD